MLSEDMETLVDEVADHLVDTGLDVEEFVRRLKNEMDARDEVEA